MFAKYCTNPVEGPIITKGEEEIVFVAFRGRTEAIRSLQAGGQQSENFPELQVAPASRVNQVESS